MPTNTSPMSWPALPPLSVARLVKAWMGLGLLALAVPTLVMIARESWSDEQSQQGPLVLMIGGWLLWRRWPQMARVGRSGALWVSLAGFAATAVVYVVGRVSATYLAEAYALYGFAIVAVYALVGVQGLRLGMFPLAFLAFAAPVPFAVGWPVTVTLRLWISEFTIRVLQFLGTEATRDGLTLYVSNYRIEIEQACSGMNSLLALSALGSCYVYLRRDPPSWYLVVMLPFIILIAIAANFARVLLLAAMTLTVGDGLAQGWLHQMLGFITFLIALVLTFSIDALAAKMLRPGSQRLQLS